MKPRIALCSILIGASTVHAQASIMARSQPGTLRVVNQIPQANDLSAAQRAAATAATDRVLEVLRRDPALANPVGYSVVLRVSARPRMPGDPPNMPFHSVIRGSVKYFEKTKSGGVELGNGGWDFQVAVNDVGYDFEVDNSDPEVDRAPRVMGADEGETSTYRVSGNFRGHPIYGGNCTYLSHASVPPVVPVTQERYLTMELLKMKGESSRHESQRQTTGAFSSNSRLNEFLRGRPEREAQNKKTLDGMKSMGLDSAQLRQVAEQFKEMEVKSEAALRAETTDGTDQRMADIVQKGRTGESQQIAEMQAKLDAMSPAERQSQVALVIHGRGMFTMGEVSDTATLPLVQPNTAFYSASLGPNVPQVIWVCAYHFQGLEDRGYERLADGSSEQLDEKKWNELRIRDVVRFRDQLDWAALDALIKP